MNSNSFIVEDEINNLELKRQKRELKKDIEGCNIRLKQLIESFSLETWQNQAKMSKNIISLITDIMKKNVKLSKMK